MLNTRRLSGFVEWMRKGLSAKCLGGGVVGGGVGGRKGDGDVGRDLRPWFVGL